MPHDLGIAWLISPLNRDPIDREGIGLTCDNAHPGVFHRIQQSERMPEGGMSRGEPLLSDPLALWGHSEAQRMHAQGINLRGMRGACRSRQLPGRRIEGLGIPGNLAAPCVCSTGENFQLVSLAKRCSRPL